MKSSSQRLQEKEHFSRKKGRKGNAPIIASLCALLLATSVLTVACAPVRQEIPQEYATGLAVAPFSQPEEEWILLKGELPADTERASAETMRELTESLKAGLREKGAKLVSDPEEISRCKEKVLERITPDKGKTLDYWSEVGLCAEADYLLVPQILSWRERVGTSWGVQKSAKVHMRMELIDAQNKELVGSFGFRKEQVSLTRDLLQIRTFIRLGGRWVTAQELTELGVDRGLRELGL